MTSGYYWVRCRDGGDWQVGRFAGVGEWYLMGDAILDADDPVQSVAEIGPRIEPPQEGVI